MAAEPMQQYEVLPGDTLIGIGESLLARPTDWKQLQKLNAVTDPYRLRPGSTLRIPLRLLKPEPLEATLEALAGEVRINGQVAKDKDKLAVGQTLSTGAESYVVLRLPDDSRVVVKPNSNLRLEVLQRERVRGQQASRVDLRSGRMDNFVQPQKGPAARYEVRTPTAVIGVRGTQFRTAVDPEAQDARVEVTEGAVQASDEKRNAALRVPAGEGAVLAQGGSLRSLPLLPAPDTSGLPTLFERPLIRVPLPASPAAKGHRLTVVNAATEGFQHPVFEGVEMDREARIPGLPDGEYRLLLRAIDERGLEGLDAQASFRLKARPEPPFPTQPSNGGKQRGERADFAWTGQAGITRYRIQVASSADFSQIVAQDDAVDATRLSLALPPGDYLWRLASVRPDGDRGPWGDAQRFSLKPAQAAPEAPSLNDKGLNFAWPAEPGQRFEFEMARDAAFTQIVMRQETAVAQLSLPPPSAGTYYVRVKAIDADGFVGEWSGTQQFEIPRDWRWLWLLTPLLLVL